MSLLFVVCCLLIACAATSLAESHHELKQFLQHFRAGYLVGIEAAGPTVESAEMDALLAAAAAAGACDAADDFVSGNAAPCSLYWGDNLTKKAAAAPQDADAERKRCRPAGSFDSMTQWQQ